MNDKDITLEMLAQKKPEELMQMLSTMDNGKYKELLPIFILVHNARNIVLIYKYLRKQILQRKIREMNLGSSNQDVSDLDMENIQASLDAENESDNEWPKIVQVYEEAQSLVNKLNEEQEKLDNDYDSLDELTKMFIKTYLNKAKLEIKKEIFKKH